MEAEKDSAKCVVRVWSDGCFDITHYGHANQLRQAKAMGNCLVVGVSVDEDVMKYKGPPVFTQEERTRMVRGIKWVDEVVLGIPWVLTIETLDKYDCAFLVHGDDIVLTPDGTDTYHLPKKVGRFKECRRTDGISTTDMVGRMLLLTKRNYSASTELQAEHISMMQDLSSCSSALGPWTCVSQYLPTNQTFVQCIEGLRAKPTDRIVYVAGAFDMFHIGHLSFLEEAAKCGDYVIVGIHTDADVNYYKGQNYPIMFLHERVFNVVACRYVNEVVIGAPYTVSKEMMNHFCIDVVLHGETPILPDADGSDPYLEPKNQGRFRIINSNNDVTTTKIVQRIIEHRLEYEIRNAKKWTKENAA